SPRGTEDWVGCAPLREHNGAVATGHVGYHESAMAINVRLLDHTSDPMRSLYIAYRTAYSALTPQTIADRIESERITREQMLDFIEKRLETGHASPLEQVWFEYAISGVSRAF